MIPKRVISKAKFKHISVTLMISKRVISKAKCTFLTMLKQ